MQQFIGTKMIVTALLNYGRSLRDKRSFSERYNIIMEAIYGDECQEHLWDYKTHGGQHKKVKDGITIIEVIAEMYEQSQVKQYESDKALASDFVDKIAYDGTRESAIIRLRNEYKKHLPKLKDEVKREILIEDARAELLQDGYDDNSYALQDSLKKMLELYGWEFEEWWDEDYNEN